MNQPLFIETIKVKDGIFYNMPLHIERLQKTAYEFFKTKPELKLSGDMIPEHLKKGVTKCRVLYASDIVSVEFEKYTFKKIESLVVVEDNTIDYEYKSVNREHLNKLYARKANASDIIISKNGFITDTLYANLVFENKQGLFTPSSYLLAGTKRKYLLEKGIIREKPIRASELHSYSRVYLINAMIDLEDAICTSIIYQK